MHFERKRMTLVALQISYFAKLLLVNLVSSLNKTVAGLFVGAACWTRWQGAKNLAKLLSP